MSIQSWPANTKQLASILAVIQGRLATLLAGKKHADDMECLAERSPAKLSDPRMTMTARYQETHSS